MFDRLLARLRVVAENRWILKGGLALDYRLGNKMRTTKDMDLARADDEESATSDFLAAQAVDLSDHFVFQIERAEHLDLDAEGASIRYQVRAELAGREFDRVTVDVAFTDILISDAEIVRGRALLSFAGIESTEIPVLPIEQHIAEKVHAYTRLYRGSQSSSRVRDLVDLVLIRDSFPLGAGHLRHALEATFQARGTHPLPEKLPPPPVAWQRPYQALAIELMIDGDLLHAYSSVESFISPILQQSLSDDASWDPSVGAWG